MANKLKTEVVLNTPGAHITLELTSEQASKLLELFYTGETASINLVTPTNGAMPVHVRENPAVYAS